MNSWRQGSVVPNKIASDLQLVSNPGEQFAMIITHDCDCVCDANEEPNYEVVTGRIIGKADGNLTHAKSTRKLHLKLSTSGRTLELSALRKAVVPKKALMAAEPEMGWEMTLAEKRILVSWLAARYKRAAFPDELVRRLRPVQGVFKEANRTNGNLIRGIFLDFDPRSELAQTSREPYSLVVSIVYESESQEAEDAAKRVVEKLQRAFEQKFKVVDTQLGLQWHEIELQICAAVSDVEFTYLDSLSTFVYRLDEVSLRCDPRGVVPD